DHDFRWQTAGRFLISGWAIRFSDLAFLGFHGSDGRTGVGGRKDCARSGEREKGNRPRFHRTPINGYSRLANTRMRGGTRERVPVKRAVPITSRAAGGAGFAKAGAPAPA